MPERLRIAVAAALLVVPALGAAQTAPVKGEAVLKHPLGVLATKTVDAIAAGRFDEVMALRTKSDLDDWKSASAADRKDFAGRLKERAPAPAAFADLVRKAGELTVEGESASLEATTPSGTLRQAFVREGGQWRVAFGPMFLARDGGGAAPASQARLEGAELARHPALAVVQQYADLVHAGRVDEALARFGSTQAQARWKALPAGEKKESAAFRRRTLPTRAALTQSAAAGGVLIVEGDTATLNLITMEPATSGNGRGSSTTVAIPLALDNAQWKVAQ